MINYMKGELNRFNLLYSIKYFTSDYIREYIVIYIKFFV